MASNQTTLSGLPIKTVLDPTDRFIIYSTTANGDFSIAASALAQPTVASSNGSTTLGGGVILNWGNVSANNSTPATITFTTPYASSAFGVNLTGTAANTNAQATVLSLTSANVVTNSTANVTFFYTSLGI